MASEFPNEPGGVPPQPVPPSAPAPAGGGMIGRIQRLLLKPKEEWARIDAEPMTVQGIMTSWVAPLAAIGPIAKLIQGFLFPPHIPFTNIVLHPNPASLVVEALLTWVLGVGMTYVWALIVDMLAPSFGGTKNPIAALKVTAFTGTAIWICGVFYILPLLGVLAILGLYSFYLLWVGGPMLMKVPQDKAPGFVIVSIVVGIVAWVVAYLVAGAVVGAMFVTTQTVIPTAGGTITF